MPTSITRTELRLEMERPQRPFVEALGAGYFADAHLPGAINIPPGQVDRLAPILIRDLNARIGYCSGRCGSSRIVLRYCDIRVYVGGKEDCVEHGLPIDRPSNGACAHSPGDSPTSFRRTK